MLPAFPAEVLLLRIDVTDAHVSAGVQIHVILRHALRREAALELCADAGAAERWDTPDRLDRLLLAVDDESGHTILEHLGNRTVLERDHRVPQAIASIITSRTARARDGEQKAGRVAEQLLFLILADLAMNSTWPSESRAPPCT